jgi:hypothetical protein
VNVCMGERVGPVSCCQLVLGIKRIVMVVSQWEVAIWTQSIVFLDLVMQRKCHADVLPNSSYISS